MTLSKESSSNSKQTNPSGDQKPNLRTLLPIPFDELPYYLRRLIYCLDNSNFPLDTQQDLLRFYPWMRFLYTDQQLCRLLKIEPAEFKKSRDRMIDIGENHVRKLSQLIKSTPLDTDEKFFRDVENGVKNGLTQHQLTKSLGATHDQTKQAIRYLVNSGRLKKY